MRKDHAQQLGVKLRHLIGLPKICSGFAIAIVLAVGVPNTNAKKPEQPPEPNAFETNYQIDVSIACDTCGSQPIFDYAGSGFVRADNRFSSIVSDYTGGTIFVLNFWNPVSECDEHTGQFYISKSNRGDVASFSYFFNKDVDGNFYRLVGSGVFVGDWKEGSFEFGGEDGATLKLNTTFPEESWTDHYFRVKVSGTRCLNEGCQ